MGRLRTASLLLILALLLTLVSGCSPASQNSTKITDNKSVYAQDNDELENIYVTIVKENTVTMDQVKAWNVEMGYAKPSLNVRFDYGQPATDETGVKANAVLSQRGNAATTGTLKSYKIKLLNDSALWKGQKTLNLNKHPFDLSKIRNKLSFDLISMFPDTFSCRTQFCHLYIRDLNSSSKGYVDYGLFTHVEDVGRNYLASRGIKPNAYLYKANSFEFLAYPEVLKNVNEPGYSKEEFENILEIKGTEEHSRLISMLRDVNDESQDINDVIAKHFDRDNYVTWLAMNVLFGNVDTSVANFILMSPSDQDKWYFIPWDYEDTLDRYHQPGTEITEIPSYLSTGISMYWHVPMHRRFLQEPKNLADLTAKIEELSAIATKQVVAEKVSKYYASTNALVKSLPDSVLIKDENATVQDYENEILRVPGTLDYGKQVYYQGLKTPMPFELHEVKQDSGKLIFSWDSSYDFDGDSLSYDFAISSTPDFEEVLIEKTKLQDTSTAVDLLPAGTYYWKVEVSDASGNRQIAFGSYLDEKEQDYYFGVSQLIIK